VNDHGIVIVDGLTIPQNASAAPAVAQFAAFEVCSSLRLPLTVESHV
jgi:hypothetical protein